MNDEELDVVIKEIAHWALSQHQESVDEHLDLSDGELNLVFAWLGWNLPARQISTR